MSWRVGFQPNFTPRGNCKTDTKLQRNTIDPPRANAKTKRRHRDHIGMLGGEIIRRRHEDPASRKQRIKTRLLNLIEEEGGPPIWPRITECEQSLFDATCRKFIDSSSRLKSLKLPSDYPRISPASLIFFKALSCEYCGLFNPPLAT